MQLSIAIVNYCTPRLVIACLRSLAGERAAGGVGFSVVVADNASPDDSVEVLGGAIEANGWGDWVTLLALPENGGFAYGNNRAIESAMARSEDASMFVLLNPDTVVRPGAIERLVRFAESHPAAGIVGSRLLDADGQVQSAAKRFPAGLNSLESAARTGLISRLFAKRLISIPPRDEPHQCDWVSGAAFLVRREVIDRIGLMDEGFFLYFEEVDFCRRAREAGFEVWHEPSSVVVHLEGASTGIGQPKRKPGWWLSSRRRFFVKAYGVLGLVWVDLCWLVGRWVFLTRDVLERTSKRATESPRFTRDVIFGDIKAILNGEVWRIKR